MEEILLPRIIGGPFEEQLPLFPQTIVRVFLPAVIVLPKGDWCWHHLGSDEWPEI